MALPVLTVVALVYFNLPGMPPKKHCVLEKTSWLYTFLHLN